MKWVRGRWSVAFLLVACLLVGSVRGQQQEADVAVDFGAGIGSGPPRWGTNVWWTDQDAEVWTSRWDEMGLTLARVPVPHALIEPVNDNGDPQVVDPAGFLLDTPIVVSPTLTRTMTYRQWFEALRDRPSVEAMLFFSYLSPWLTDNPPHTDFSFPAAPYPPNDLDEYREFVQELLRYLVEDIGFPPERILVEAMNEPDLRCGQDPEVPCFWQDWTMQDVADVVEVTCEAARAVDDRIRVVGLAECCGTNVVRTLLNQYPEGECLDGLTYHYYSPSGYDLDAALDRAAQIAPYGLPVYLDEYGSFEYLSEGQAGGLWHGWALPVLWEAGIIPAQYPISEFPGHPEPYNRMGLFLDWTGGWERKPAYWVYTHFFGHVAGREMVSATASVPLDVLAVRRLTADEVEVALWVVNRGSLSQPDRRFVVRNFPSQVATMQVFDGLAGPGPVATATVTGAPLVFTATVPAESVRLFVLRASAWAPFHLYLPVILRRYDP